VDVRGFLRGRVAVAAVAIDAARLRHVGAGVARLDAAVAADAALARASLGVLGSLALFLLPRDTEGDPLRAVAPGGAGARRLLLGGRRELARGPVGGEEERRDGP